MFFKPWGEPHRWDIHHFSIHICWLLCFNNLQAATSVHMLTLLCTAHMTTSTVLHFLQKTYFLADCCKTAVLSCWTYATPPWLIHNTGLAWLSLTRHVSPARQGIEFPLQWGYLIERVSLTKDTLLRSSQAAVKCYGNIRSSVLDWNSAVVFCQEMQWLKLVISKKKYK